MAGPAGLASFESPSAAFDWLRCQTGATRSVATATRQRAIQLGRATGHGGLCVSLVVYTCINVEGIGCPT